MFLSIDGRLISIFLFEYFPTALNISHRASYLRYTGDYSVLFYICVGFF